jgi:hypothetical protein
MQIRLPYCTPEEAPAEMRVRLAALHVGVANSITSRMCMCGAIECGWWIFLYDVGRKLLINFSSDKCK